jgi:hypothetical protein
MDGENQLAGGRHELLRSYQGVADSMAAEGYRRVTAGDVSEVHRRIRAGQPMNGCLDRDIAATLTHCLGIETVAGR